MYLTDTSCTLVFTETIFIIDKLWNQPISPPTDECIKNVVYIHNGFFSAIKKKQVMSFLENECNQRLPVSELSQSLKDKDKYYMFCLNGES